ncbi:SDR family NAD(P)-dependent oxidoreductase [Kaistia granuli]|uniref:SDR family NAD(P)-dependent oxidoreductase n=1 Tax=Kaistia granuli TaxID=363259 RepID=UPI00037FA5F4|nr:glucose 1-dehydrogenase [Kaistia granuli]
MSKLTGKVAVVTGASKGIGAGIARELAAAGASVVVNYASSKEGADRVVAEIEGKGGKAVAVQGDVSKSADVTRLFAEAKAAFGSLDILVNNAGVYQFGSLDDLTEEEFHRQFNTNVLGLLLTTQEGVRHFGAEGGSVINIGSTISQLPMANSSIYTATKSAVDGITQVLSKELAGQNIRVNSINPGSVETEGTHAAGMAGSELEKQIVAQTPLGRIGRPDDIGTIAVFLASPESGWLTGERLLASGGMR